MKSKNFSGNWMAVLLIAVSFFAGFLFFKVRSLEQKPTALGTETTNQPTVPAAAVKNLDAVPPVTDKDHIIGKRDARLVLVEYSDLECPFCKSFHPTMQQIVEDYGDQIAWVYRHYPLPFHQNAQKEAEASECAADLGGNEVFWKYIDTIYERTEATGTGFALDKLTPLAVEVGLDRNKFKQCLDSGKFTKKVKDEMAGGAAAGIEGTPGTIIITKSGKKELIPGALPLEQVKQQIDNLLSN